MSSHHCSPVMLLITLMFVWLHIPSSFADDFTASNTAESIFSSIDGIEFGGGLIAVIAIALGLLICFKGFHLYSRMRFYYGFIAGSIVTATLVEWWFQDEQWMLLASWISFFVGGIVVGLIAQHFYSFSVFLTGAIAGVVVAMAINASYGYKIIPGHPLLGMILWTVLLGLAGGILAIKLHKLALIVATAAIGSAMAVWGIGYFVGDYPSAWELCWFLLWHHDDDWVYELPDVWFGYLCAMIVLFVLGVLRQYTRRKDQVSTLRAIVYVAFPASPVSGRRHFRFSRAHRQRNQHNCSGHRLGAHQV